MQTFSIGLAAGLVAGLGWAAWLRRITQRSYEYAVTIAVLLLLYAVVELLTGSGPLAVLAFGLVVGNSRKTRPVEVDAMERSAKRRRRWEYVPVFGENLVNLHHELVFFVRAFFFVALGVLVRLDVLLDPAALLVGTLLSLGVMAGRYWGVGVIFGRSNMPAWDRLATTLMFPLGLAAAVLSLVPYERFQLAGTENFGNYAAVAIVLTNLVSSALVFFFSQPRMRARLEAAPKKSTGPNAARARPWGPA